MAYLELAENFAKSGKIHAANIQNLLKSYLFQYFLHYLHDAITSSSGAWGFWVSQVPEREEIGQTVWEKSL